MYSRKQSKTRKHYRRHGKSCKCRGCCKRTTKRMRHRSRSRRGGSETSTGGNMTYQNGQWVSTNPVGGRS